MAQSPGDLNSTYPWKYRRKIVCLTLLFCAVGVGWLTFKGADTRLNETLALGYFGLAGAVIGAYVFGAVWHDTSLMGMRPPRRGRGMAFDPRETEAGSAEYDDGAEQ